MDDGNGGANSDFIKYAVIIGGSIINGVVAWFNFKWNRKLKKDEIRGEQEHARTLERREDWREYRRDTALKIQDNAGKIESCLQSISVLCTRIDELEKRREEGTADIEKLFTIKDEITEKLSSCKKECVEKCTELKIKISMMKNEK